MKSLYVILCLLLSAGCTISEAKKEEIKAQCESLQEFNLWSISFEGFDFAEVEKIKIIERASGEVISEAVVDLRSANYVFHAGYYLNDDLSFSASYRIDIPIKVYNTENTYDFVMGDQSVYRLHGMRQAIYPIGTMYGAGYTCRMAAYYINDSEFDDKGGVSIIKEVAN